MKKEKTVSSPAVGASSLLVIFAVLCLTVFTLLSISTVQAEKRISDTAAQAVTDYYKADLEAERIFARLRSGEAVPGVQVEAGIYSYGCMISDTQTLLVQLQKTENTWTVLCWKVSARPEEGGQMLPVWDGK